MRSIPVDTSRLGDLLVLSVKASTDQEGKQKKKKNFDGITMWKIETLLRLEARGTFKPKAEVVEISVPSRTEPDLEPMSTLLPQGLVARSWEMNGRSGIALSADAVEAI